MSKPPPARYHTTNWSSYNASLRERGSLLIWVDKNMIWRAPRDGRLGRPPVFSDAAIQFCLSIKGEGRPGNDPGDRFSPERAETRVRSSSLCARPPAWWPACSGWQG